MTEAQPHALVETEADDYNDADSAIGGSIASSTTSIGDSILAYRKENGRTYHAYKDGTCALPNDEGENDRLDHQHHLFSLTLDGKLYLSPLDEKKLHHVLDVGTGTGIWAIDFADMHPGAQVLGIDLSPIQPNFLPPNLIVGLLNNLFDKHLLLNDAEADWTYSQKFDFIYARQMSGGIQNWPRFFEQSFENLNPGGFIEVFDSIHPCKCDDGTMPDDWPVKKWSEYAIKGVKDNKEYIWPVNRWPKDKKLKELGMWSCENVTEALTGLSQAVFCRWLGWSPEQLEVFLVDVRKEFYNTKVHAYWPLILYYAQKPAENIQKKSLVIVQVGDIHER